MRVKILRSGFIRGVQVFQNDTIEIDSKQFSSQWMEMLTEYDLEASTKRDKKIKKDYREPVALSQVKPAEIMIEEVI